MRIWTVTTGEPLPIDSANPRLFRTGILVDELARRGHEVTWWTANFDHVRKAPRRPSESEVRLENGCRLMLLASRGYRSNVSLRRLLDHRELGRAFARRAPGEPRPDVIISSFPTIELSRAAVAYGVADGAAVVLDVRDLWPEIFLDEITAWLRPLARLALAPLFHEAREAFGAATAITGITSAFVDWGLERAGRERTGRDVAFPLACSRPEFEPAEIAEAEEYWLAELPSNAFVICFFGALSRQFDIETVIAAASDLEDDPRRFFFVICGDGDLLERYRARAEGRRNILFPGWVDAPQIRTLMGAAAVGLAPYRGREDFNRSIPNKVIEYLSAGLPVLTCLRGEVEKLVSSHGCGTTYREGDAASLSAQLRELCDHSERREAMATSARSLYRDRFTAEKVYGEMATYLEEMGTVK